MFINPDRLSTEEQRVVAEWLERNGCRHYIALEPIVIRGQWAEYTALCRKDERSVRRMQVRDSEAVPLGRRRVRIRHPRWAA